MSAARNLSAGSLAVAAAVVGGWALVASQGWIPAVFLPSPHATAAALVDGWRDQGWALLTAATVERMVWGWLLASLLGAALGALIGASPVLRAWLAPMLEWMRPLPASAIVPVVIALVGLSPTMVLIVITFGSIWPVLLGTAHGVANVEPRLHEVSRVLRLSRPAFLWKVALPAALPDALAGMRLALTIALILAIVGEMLASQPGLGNVILQAARSFRAPELFAGVALLGAIGLASNALLDTAERRLLRWQLPH